MAKALELFEVMKRDRRRARAGAVWPERELRAHHRATFGLSVDLMLTAHGSTLRAADVPELVEALGWCSTMRDLREDLQAGLVNVPAEVLDAARAGEPQAPSFDALAGAPAARAWIGRERARARELLDAADRKIDALERRPGRAVLRRLARSIRDFERRRFPRRFPSLAVAMETATERAQGAEDDQPVRSPLSNPSPNTASRGGSAGVPARR
jgi:phytoene/squalene synthetase